jgi:hypothetical protein
MTSLKRKNKSLEDLDVVEKGSIEDIFLGLEMNTGLNDEEIGQDNERYDRVNVGRFDNLGVINNNISFQVANATAAQQAGAVTVCSSISDNEGNVDQAGSDSSGYLDMTRDDVEQEHGRRRLEPQGNETETQQVVIINLRSNGVDGLFEKRTPTRRFSTGDLDRNLIDTEQTEEILTERSKSLNNLNEVETREDGERLGWRTTTVDLTPVKALKGWPTTRLKEDERGYLPGLTADDIRTNEKRAEGVGVNMSLKLILDIRTEHVTRCREDEEHEAE